MDTHAIGVPLYIMIYTLPSDGSNWAGLYWTIDSSDLDVAVVDYTTGRHKLCLYNIRGQFII